MAKVIVAKLNRDRKAKSNGLRVAFRRIRNHEGRLNSVYALDLASPKFELEFGAVFQRAVTKARKENKKVVGQSDVEPPTE